MSGRGARRKQGTAEGATRGEVESLRQQIAALRADLGAGPRRGRRRSTSRSRRRSGSRNRAMPAARSSNAPSTFKSVEANTGGMTVEGEEMVYTIKVGVNSSSSNKSWSFNPGGNQEHPPQVRALSEIYDEFRVNRIEYRYEPMVGTTFNGAIVLGISPGIDDLNSFTRVASCQPNVSGPLYNVHRIRCPASYLRQKRWYNINHDHVTPSQKQTDDDIAMMGYWVDCTASTVEQSIGRIWVKYSYTMQGFRSLK